MADVALSAQLQQWSFDKSTSNRSERSDSTTSSPDLSHHEPQTLRLRAAAVRAATSMDPKDTRSLSLQERYLSSEEELSPLYGNSSDDEDYESDVSIHEAEVQENFFKARTMSISRLPNNGKRLDMAVTVSYVSAGRPKMIELASSPPRDYQRSASLAQLPVAAINKLRQEHQQARRSMFVRPSTTRSNSPAMSIESRRPSTTGSRPFMHRNKSMLLSESESGSGSGSSVQSRASTEHSSTRSVSEDSAISTRPVSVADTETAPPRSSLYVHSTTRPTTSPLAPFPPLTPQSPPPHAFLSSDPYENSTTNAASPIIKSAPHKRLRSISQKLSLAKIAIIAPGTKKWDPRRTGTMPPTPSTPGTPLTAPLPSTSQPNKLRRNSRILSRPGTARGASPDIPPVPALLSMSPGKSSSPAVSPGKKMVARGAGEREPILELPPCPADEDGVPGSAVGSIKARRVRKRKSLMDLL